MNAKINMGLVNLNNLIQPPRISTSGVLDQSQGLAVFRLQFTLDTDKGRKDLERAGRDHIREQSKARKSWHPLSVLSHIFQQKGFEEEEGLPSLFLVFHLSY